METKSPVKTLLIEDQADYALLVCRYFASLNHPAFDVVHVETLHAALEAMNREVFDVILTDLSLPDSRDLNTFNSLHQKNPSVPIVIISALDNEQMAIQAVRDGAQDYLVKGDIESKVIARVLLYAIERNQMRLELKSLSLTDDLTGLNNRRGFVTLAEQHIKLSQRSLKGFALLICDLDSLKAINDRFGHGQGDQALIAVARILQSAFRQSDIIARIGGDEFAVLAIDLEKTKIYEMMDRLNKHIRAFNDKSLLPCPLSMSAGFAYADPSKPIILEHLISTADKDLYREKRLKHPKSNPEDGPR